MNNILENRNIEQDAIIEWLKPKELMPSDEFLECPCAECPCAKNNIKPKTNFDKITESMESLAEFIETISIKEISKERIVKWLQEECEQ